mmetsp:Transcript_10154/g.11687  ORF Transcript_10154/g.11687 Transcript_10154/m.11687 type:complete len:372 (+) Transcript_10154:318-1433(+)
MTLRSFLPLAGSLRNRTFSTSWYTGSQTCSLSLSRKGIKRFHFGFSTLSQHQNGRVDLQVPYSEKEDAKSYGAKWDPKKRVWYAPNGEKELIERFKDKRVYLDVPFEERHEAKSNGAWWDPNAKLWYARNSESNLVSRWPMKDKIYVDVPYSEKDVAKDLGCAWDRQFSVWFYYDDNENIEAISRQFKEIQVNKQLLELKGEDRAFGGNTLFVDLIPSSCWFSNARSCISRSDWGRVRSHVVKRVNNECETCGTKTKNLDVHERWEYDDRTDTQSLKRLVALCKPCHTVTHFGLATIEGKSDEALRHLMKVNGMTELQASTHIDDAFDLWEVRNEKDWILDISLLTKNGILLQNEIEDRAEYALRRLNREE